MEKKIIYFFFNFTPPPQLQKCKLLIGLNKAGSTMKKSTKKILKCDRKHKRCLMSDPRESCRPRRAFCPGQCKRAGNDHGARGSFPSTAAASPRSQPKAKALQGIKVISTTTQQISLREGRGERASDTHLLGRGVGESSACLRIHMQLSAITWS